MKYITLDYDNLLNPTDYTLYYQTFDLYIQCIFKNWYIPRKKENGENYIPIYKKREKIE